MMNLIVAVDKNWAIGKDGDQLVYIPKDLKHFEALTFGHPVILGRKTLETFPGGHPLKGRRNLILSRSLDSTLVKGAEVFSSLQALLSVDLEDAFVIGGASVYTALLNRCSIAYVTKIDLDFQDTDCFFPNLDEHQDWHVTEVGQELEEHGIRFRYMTYKRQFGGK